MVDPLFEDPNEVDGLPTVEDVAIGVVAEAHCVHPVLGDGV